MGRVILVGAGPGAPDLITVRGADALRRADALLVVDGPPPESDRAYLDRFAPDAARFALSRPPRATRPIAGGASEPATNLRVEGSCP